MILLDTDHLSVLGYSEDARCAALTARLESSPDPQIATTVISLEEQLRGWLAQINRFREVHRQIPAYQRLAKLVFFFSEWEVVGFDERAAERFTHLRKRRIPLATQDLKIASIALEHDALLLSANLRDFRRVPGLRVENWMK